MTATDKVLGSYLFIEGLASILFSQDQQTVSQIGRAGRMGIGVWLYAKEP